MPEMKQESFVTAMRQHFGLLPGQTLTQFGAELKALSSEDRAYFVEQFRAIGIEIIVRQ